jgi:acyl-CoA synthetase (AMP-forming)/AMP-acid ligase II
MPANKTLADLFQHADANGPAVVLPKDGSATSYRDLVQQIEAMAGAFQKTGLEPGQTVAIVLPNGLEYLVAFLAVTRARLAAAPLNPAYKPEELRFYLEDSGARAVITGMEPHPVCEVAKDLGLKLWQVFGDQVGRIQLHGEKIHASFDAPTKVVQRGPTDTYVAGNPVVSALYVTGTADLPRPEDIALFLHTSGTTSRPKGVPLTHANLMTSIANIAAHYQLSPADTGLVVMPLFHVHGLIGATLSSLYAGSKLVMPPRFSAGAFWPAVKTYGVTWYSAVPTIHQVLLSRAEADNAPVQSGFRFIRSCSSALAPATLAQLEGRFHAPVLEAYAMTEAAHQMTSNPLPPGIHKPGSVGRGTNVDVAIMDEAGNLLPAGSPGEVVVRGDNVTRGYHNNPQANADAFTNGWFRTGDRGVMDSDGYLTLIGRIKELINRGGEKISPLEVDAALLAHPAVAEAACFAAPHPMYGEEVHAAVVVRIEVTVMDLQEHCGAKLADFKVPKTIHIVKELPKGPTGKVQRRFLKDHFCK